ncbi:hypothetical protein RRG08_009085 [Elysia crispata]|uniref:Uncharacterized protein n=1 Tax=Elysia crispata TaxID=231223 RepID=A0AAE1CUI1_9GAST|nr:hypothetical protein RRG08_009085 [Elysia crispata]
MSRKQAKEPERPHETGQKPWEKVESDLFEHCPVLADNLMTTSPGAATKGWNLISLDFVYPKSLHRTEVYNTPQEISIASWKNEALPRGSHHPHQHLKKGASRGSRQNN